MSPLQVFLMLCVYVRSSYSLQKNCANNLFTKEQLVEARSKRKAWENSVELIVEQYYDSLPVLNQKERFSWPDMKDKGHRQFDVLGPVVPRCHNLEKYGEGDEEKRACGLSEVQDDCTVVSIGSKNQWSFEESIAKSTRCRIVTFDCTCGKLIVPPSIESRVSAYEICIASKNFVNDRGWVFMNWTSALLHAGVQTVSHLKMDIEGFEYPVLRDIVLHRVELCPSQISLELHYITPMTELGWHRRLKTAGELALFMLFLYSKGNYFIVDRHDNPYCAQCTELVLARLI